MKTPQRANVKTVVVPNLTRAEALAWARQTLVSGGKVKPGEISFRGLRAADPISTIRNRDLIPVKRIMEESERYQVRGEDGRLITRSRRGKTAFYQITPVELTMYRLDRSTQIERMSEQKANRRRRDLGLRVVREMTKAGELANVPAIFLEWSSIEVPTPGAGTSAPTITSQDSE